MEQSPFADFAAYLAQLKDERGVSQSDIARALDVAPSQTSAWLSGRSRPKPENLERMAKVYGLDLDALLKLCRYRSSGANGQVDPDEAELLALFRQVPDEHRPIVKSMLRGAIGMRAPGRVTKQRKPLGRSNQPDVRQPRPRHRPYQSQSVTTMIGQFGFQPA